MTDLLSIMWVPFLACLVLVGILGYLGMHILQRGVIFVDLALAQFAALGSTLAVLFDQDVHGALAFGWSLAFTFLGALIFSLTRLRHVDIPQEAFIGVAWAVASSAAIVALHSAPHGAEHIEEMLVGSILWVPIADVAKAAAMYLSVGFLHWVFRHKFLRISLDPDGATAAGMRVRWWDFLFYASFGFVVTSSVKIAGVLLVFCFLIVPSIVGALFARSVSGRLMIAWGFGWVVSMLGCVLSYTLDLPTGAAVVCTFGIALVLVLVIRAPRLGRIGSGGG